MKTISIEMKEDAYEAFKNFLHLLPQDSFVIYDDDDTPQERERAIVHRYNEQIDSGTLDAFESFEKMKNGLRA
ncbi:MAG: hypothetical protein JXK05_03020 [Campylobacterales bacterium]|nr:hypothetical protein [Campylobacterales bacterium]